MTLKQYQWIVGVRDSQSDEPDGDAAVHPRDHSGVMLSIGLQLRADNGGAFRKSVAKQSNIHLTKVVHPSFSQTTFS